MEGIYNMNNTFKQNWALRSYRKMTRAIMSLEEAYSQLSVEELRLKTKELKQQLATGKPLKDLRIEAFALVREAAFRVLGYRHFEVQLIGGLALFEGNVAEMKTGEGKTLTTTLAAYLHALKGKGVHVITVNEYLAERDYEAMSPIHELLGLRVGINLNGMSSDKKREAYLCDITYGTGNEFGFDYLRDHHVHDIQQRVQRPFHYAIIDEVDSILIDEGRTPLILATSYYTDQSSLEECQLLISKLKEDVHFEKEENKVPVFTEEGISCLEEKLNITNLFDIEHRSTLHRLNRALTANVAFKKDVDYIVSKGKVELVAPTTGRVMEGRSLSHGLHQAIEAKEKVEITPENRTQSVVTLQHFYQKYPTISGLTGTARTEEHELYQLYGVLVVPVPTNRPVIRKDHKDEIYKTKKQKYEAIVERIQDIYSKGRPVLVGTTSIVQSMELAAYLDNTDVPFEVLNAHSVEFEAQLIQRAGQYGNVMIATNMAGRGTDILLSDETRRLGGLYVIGTERHESRRIDLQLVGRAGRQGEPGESVFITSLEDDLFEYHLEEDELEKLQCFHADSKGRVIKEKKLRSMTDKLQIVSESIHYSGRDYMMKINSVVNAQRDYFYDLRDRLLDTEQFRTFLEKTIQTAVGYALEDYLEQLNNNGAPIECADLLLEDIGRFIPKERLPLVDADKKKKLKEYQDQLKAIYSHILDETDAGVLELCRIRAIYILDICWMDLIEMMEELEEGIHNVAYAQEQPLREFIMEGHSLFLMMEEKLTKEIAISTATSLFSNHRETESNDEKNPVVAV